MNYGFYVRKIWNLGSKKLDGLGQILTQAGTSVDTKLTPQGSNFGRTIESLRAKAGVPRSQVVAQAQEAGAVRDMVLGGMGMACTLRSSVQAELAAGALVELDVDMDPMHLVLSCARNPKAEMHEIDSLIEMVRQSQSLGVGEEM